MNFNLFRQAIEQLGGVPTLIFDEDCMEGGPDERVLALCLAYLAGCLLETSKEERAAHAIQNAWYRYKCRLPGDIPAV